MLYTFGLHSLQVLVKLQYRQAAYHIVYTTDHAFEMIRVYGISIIQSNQKCLHAYRLICVD